MSTDPTDKNQILKGEMYSYITNREFTPIEFAYEKISGFMPSGVLYLDRKGVVIYVNSIAAEILDIPFEQLEGHRIADLQWHVIQEDGSDFPKGQNPIDIALMTGEILTDAIMGFSFPNQKDICWLLINALPVKEVKDGRTSQVHIEFRDFTEGFQWTRHIKKRMVLFHQFRHSIESIIHEIIDPKEIYQKIVEFLPVTFSSPEITSARLTIGDQIFSTEKFHESPIKKVVPFQFRNLNIGNIQFQYDISSNSDFSERTLAADDIPLRAMAEWLGLLTQVIEKMGDIEELKDEALTAYDRMIEAWSAAVETKDMEASGHTQRVTEFALDLAEEMGFEGKELLNIRRGALLHDIGKLGIPDEIIMKPGKLTDDEFQIIKKNPQYAQKWLSKIELLQPALQIPYYHHERWDGTGYPNGLKGEDIPLVARLFAIVNVWDVLISDRPYRKAMGKEEALDLIVSESGSHFDPDVVENFLSVLSKGDYMDTSYEIKIQAFGQERVWVQHRLLTTRDWQVNAARDLFFLLLSHPEGLTKEQVGLFMWPDVSPEDLNVRFKNTLYRLRRAVGNQAILLGDQGYRFNKMLDYFFDVETFETGIQNAQEASDVLQKVSHLNKAIQQYRGDYLADFDQLWVMAERERYRRMYLDALVQSAEFFYQEMELVSALNYCQQALDEDPVLEEVHRLIMQIHAANGNKADIIRQYEQCRRVLMETFDVPPSQQTRDLFDALINS